MTDIVQRLRDTIVNETPARYPEVVSAAADEIERLRADVARLRASLRRFIELCEKPNGAMPWHFEVAIINAKKSLNGERVTEAKK